MSMGYPPQNNGMSLNLSATGAPMGGGYATQQNTNSYMGQPQQGWPPQQPSAMGAMFAGFTGQDPYNQQAVLPPSETEILMTMLDNAYPVERFLSTPLFNQILEIIGAITTFQVLNLMKSVKYSFDDENGIFSLDIASLPTELQTMSSENIGAQLSSLNAQVSQVVNHANTVKMQTLQNASQNMLHVQLQNAMANPGMMTGAAEAGGSFLRSLVTGGRA